MFCNENLHKNDRELIIVANKENILFLLYGAVLFYQMLLFSYFLLIESLLPFSSPSVIVTRYSRITWLTQVIL